MLVEQHRTIFHIIDVGTDLIHAVCRLYGHHIVDARTGEAAVWKVDGFIATIAEEDLIHGHAFHLCQFLLHLQLQRVGIAVQRTIIRILIGIEEYAGFHAFIFIARRGIGFQIPDIRTGEALQIKGRSLHALIAERL